jgi:hypothetical protein
MLVKAIVAHTEQGSGKYRAEGEEFEHSGPLYKHVEPVKGKKPRKPEDEE